jgi:lipoprotein NlpI
MTKEYYIGVHYEEGMSLRIKADSEDEAREIALEVASNADVYLGKDHRVVGESSVHRDYQVVT